ncbi:MAG: M23 family metallopeptidase [Clostridiales bacterium]|nr:M23 family metallopeptidase [Clostridiales bacterium]
MTKDIGKQKWKQAFSKKSLSKFFNQFGFYIILLVCLGIVATTAALTQGNRQKDDIGEGEDKWVPDTNIAVKGGTGTGEDIDISITDVTDPEPSGETSSGDLQSDTEKSGGNKSPKVSGTNTKPSESGKGTTAGKDDESKTQTVSASDKGAGSSTGDKSGDKSKNSMNMPVNGEIIQAYSVDSLVYSETLKEWTTHTGMDIAGDLGDEVRAALAGKVESIKEDPLQGIVITLDHGNDLKTVYIGLSTKDMVKEGQQVEANQVISGIGRSAGFEITEAAHLHFEVWLDGEIQDPQDYIKENKS